MALAPLTILVPQGAEYQAVRRGIRRARGGSTRAIPIPVGTQPVLNYLTQLQQEGKLLAQPTRILLMGLCGSLSSQYTIGDRLLYRDCVAPIPGAVPYPCDPPLTAWLHDHFPDQLHPVRALTSDRLVWSAQEKQSLGQRYQAQAVDMEGTAVLEFFHSTEFAVAMLRVVSDGVQQDLPDLTAALGQDGRLQPLPLALGMLRQPLAAARLIRGAIAGLQTLETTATTISELLH